MILHNMTAISIEKQMTVKVVVTLATYTRLTLKVWIYKKLFMVRDEEKSMLPDMQAIIWDLLGK